MMILQVRSFWDTLYIIIIDGANIMSPTHHHPHHHYHQWHHHHHVTIQPIAERVMGGEEAADAAEADAAGDDPF